MVDHSLSLPKVFCSEKLHDEALNFLNQKVHLINSYNGRLDPSEDICKYLGEAEGLINIGYQVNAKLLDSAPHLRVVSNISVGYNNLDIPELKKRNIIATNTPDVMNNSVADLIIGHMIVTCRRAGELDKAIRNAEWKEDTFIKWFGTDITGAKLGIVGCGRIGRVLAKKCISAFNMQIAYYNRHRDYEAEETLGIVHEDRDTLLQTSDFVVVLAPLNKETRHMIGKAEFDLMKPSAIFINTARGQLVNEQDLIDALMSGSIRAAGLDCFEQEPTYPENELLKLRNTFLTPHIGSSTYKTREAMVMLACREMVAALYGQGPKCVIPELR